MENSAKDEIVLDFGEVGYTPHVGQCIEGIKYTPKQISHFAGRACGIIRDYIVKNHESMKIPIFADSQPILVSNTIELRGNPFAIMAHIQFGSVEIDEDNETVKLTLASKVYIMTVKEHAQFIENHMEKSKDG